MLVPLLRKRWVQRLIDRSMVYSAVPDSSPGYIHQATHFRPPYISSLNHWDSDPRVDLPIRNGPRGGANANGIPVYNWTAFLSHVRIVKGKAFYRSESSSPRTISMREMEIAWGSSSYGALGVVQFAWFIWHWEHRRNPRIARIPAHWDRFQRPTSLPSPLDFLRMDYMFLKMQDHNFRN